MASIDYVLDSRLVHTTHTEFSTMLRRTLISRLFLAEERAWGNLYEANYKVI